MNSEIRKNNELENRPGGGSSRAPFSEKRRNLLKFLAVGGAAFIVGKILGPSINLFGGRRVVLSEGETEHLFKNFRVVERRGELGFYDSLGNEILIIEKE